MPEVAQVHGFRFNDKEIGMGTISQTASAVGTSLHGFKVTRKSPGRRRKGCPHHRDAPRVSMTAVEAQGRAATLPCGAATDDASGKEG